MKNILITGGAGFIGRYMSDLYLTKGFSVTIIDNLSTGNLSNVNYLKRKFNQKIRFIKSNVESYKSLKKEVKNSFHVIHTDYCLRSIIIL